MNNPTQGSVTDSVTQKAHTFLESPTFPSSQQDRVARYMAMARAALSASAAPGDGVGTDQSYVRTVQESGAESRTNRKERRRSYEKAYREAVLTSSPQEFPQSVREAYSASARVMVRPVQGPQLEPVPEVPDLAELLDLAVLCPKRGRGARTEGAGRLARLLDELGRHVFKTRAYRLTPGQIVFHTSQELLAEALGVDVATIRRWTRQLEALGYCDSRPHYSDMSWNGETVAAVDGTLYAVRLQPGQRARLGYDDLCHQWRDLEADRKAGRTAWALLKAVRVEKQKARLEGKKKLRGSTSSTEGGTWVQTLKDWAVTPGTTNTPLEDDPRNFPPEEARTVQDVVYALPLVLDAHPTKRAALVGMLGSTLARQLHDHHSRRWYCRLIWDAYAASVEGRQGLQQLAAQLARLDADRHEWRELRNPAALLVARLRYPQPCGYNLQ